MMPGWYRGDRDHKKEEDEYGARAVPQQQRSLVAREEPSRRGYKDDYDNDYKMDRQ